MKTFILTLSSILFSTQLFAQCVAGVTAASTGTPGEVVFTNTSSAPDSNAIYTLLPGDGSVYTLIGSGGVINHTYPAAGTYNYCIIVDDFATPCSDTSCSSIVVSGPAANCDASFLSIPLSNFEYNFNTTGNASTGAVTHSWDFGDGTTSTLENPNHTYADTGVFIVCHTVTGNQCSDTYCDTVSISASPGGGGGGTGGGNMPCTALNVSYSWMQDPSASQTVNITNTSTYGGGTVVGYLWEFGDGNSSTQAFPTHTYSNLGTYNVCLTLTVDYGSLLCTAIYCDSISVTSKASGFTINVVESSLTVNEQHIKEFSVFPNPTEGMLTVTMDQLEGNETISVVNLQGQEVKKIKVSDFSTQLDVTELTSGTYLLFIEGYLAQRFVKK